MSVKCQGMTGRIYHIEGNKIASGGEGTIYPIEGQDSLVAKIFKPNKRSSEREEKLCCMVQTKLNEEQSGQVTWPQDVLYDQSGFVGYVMPILKDSESISAIYSNGFDNKYDLRYRLLAAINLCVAVQTVHDMGQVCGDLNPQNICINLNTNDRENAFHITLVDTDSYHFLSGEKTFRCEVGLAEYIAPEVQQKMTGGLTLKNAELPTYTRETDLFALAVHIFTLLMNGCHPFACAKSKNGNLEATMPQMNESYVRDSVVAPQPIENIKDGFFPFYDVREGITAPVYAPSFESLPKNLQQMFVRTFVDGYTNPSLRISAREWIAALKGANVEMVQCSEKQHYFFSQGVSCPFCSIEERMMKWIPPEPLPSVEPIFDSEEEPEQSSTESNRMSGVKIWAIVQLSLLMVYFLYDFKLLWDMSMSQTFFLIDFIIIVFGVVSTYVFIIGWRPLREHEQMAVLWLLETLYNMVILMQPGGFEWRIEILLQNSAAVSELLSATKEMSFIILGIITMSVHLRYVLKKNYS